MDAEEAAEKAARRAQPEPTRTEAAGVARYGAGLPHAGDRSQRRRPRPSGPGSPITAWKTSRHAAAPSSRSTTPSYLDWFPAALAAYQRHAPDAVHDQVRDAGREDRQLSDQALRDHPGGPPRRRGRLRRCGGAPAGGETRRRLSGGHHQPQLRAQGVQVRAPPGWRGRRGADRAADRVGHTANVDQGPSKKAWGARRFRSPSRSGAPLSAVGYRR